MTPRTPQRPPRQEFQTPKQIQKILKQHQRMLNTSLSRLKYRLDHPRFLESDDERKSEED